MKASDLSIEERVSRLERRDRALHQRFDQLEEDVWQKVNDLEDLIVSRTDESNDIANRARRGVERLKKEMEEWTAE